LINYSIINKIEDQHMPILDKWDLQLTTDQVLRAQGADPEVIRSRRPKLVKSTEEGLVRAEPLLQPLVLYEKYQVKAFMHERLELVPHNSDQGKHYLSSQLIGQKLSSAQEIIVVLCTIGSDLDNSVSSLFKVDPMIALAIDGVGSAAVEMLAIQACNYFEDQISNEGLKPTIPLNPGMVGWPVEIGQPQIFSLLDSESINVTLTESCMMIPNKSLSMVIGIGEGFSSTGSSCEYCSLKGICRYQNHYAE
jgi:hypothetical protein